MVGKGRAGGRWGEMTQTLYVHMNKRKKLNHKKRTYSFSDFQDYNALLLIITTMMCNRSLEFICLI
jgi:hypothetical protein